MGDDDHSVFREAMRDVKPLEADPQAPPDAVRKPKRRQAPTPYPSMADQLAAMEPAQVDTGEELLFRGAGISERVFKRLRRGAFSIQDELDLHGLTVAEARVSLKAFIAECADDNRGCVRVVHGKGLGSGRRGPVLKGHVNSWLRQWDEVLAFATARPGDGGTGAVYVLIRRR